MTPEAKPPRLDMVAALTREVREFEDGLGDEPLRYRLDKARKTTLAWFGKLIGWRKRAERDPRTILGPAVRFSDLGVIALPSPATHDDVIMLVEQQIGSRRAKHQGERGFVIADGQFVRPREALVLARATGQVAQHDMIGIELKCGDL